MECYVVGFGEVRKKMHKHVFDGENRQVWMKDVYHNFNFIFKATFSQHEKFERQAYSDYRKDFLPLRKELGFLITFTRCMLKRCVEEDTSTTTNTGVVINRSLVDILTDVESHFVALLKRCSSLLSRGDIGQSDDREVLRMGSFEHMVSRVSNAYFSVLATDSSSPSSTSFVHSRESMAELLDRLLENLNQCDLEDEIIKTCVDKLEFLRYYLQFTSGSLAESLKEDLIFVESVAEIAACFSFLKKYGKLSSSENYLQIKNRMEWGMGIAVLKLQGSTDNLPTLTDRLLKVYVDFVQDILTKLIYDDEADDLMSPLLKNQFEDLHKVNFQFMVCLFLSYPLEELANLRRQFQTLVGDVGSLVLLSFNGKAKATGTTDLGISDLLQQAHLLEYQITDIVLCTDRNKEREMKGSSVELDKICKKMHKHVFDGENIDLRRVLMKDVYENFNVIFKATFSQHEIFEKQAYSDYRKDFLPLRKELGFLITFTRCMLKRCEEEDTTTTTTTTTNTSVVINLSLVDILRDVESHFMDLLQHCSSLLSRGSISEEDDMDTLRMGRFEHMVSRVSNTYLTVFTTDSSSPSSTGFMHSYESMVEFLEQLLENLNQFDLEDKSIKTYVEKLEFLRNYLQLTRECWVSGQSLKEFLICVEVVGEIGACYSFLKKYGKCSSSENYLQFKDRVESKMSIAVLKFQDSRANLPPLTDGLLKVSVDFVQEVLTAMINNDEAINLMTSLEKNQFEDFHKVNFQFLAYLFLNYPLEELADMRRQFQTLVGYVVGSLLLLPFNGKAKATGTTDLGISDLLQQAHLLEYQVTDIVLFTDRNKERDMKGSSVELGKICKKMHKHVFDGENIDLRQVLMKDVNENFNLIFKATMSQYEVFQKQAYSNNPYEIHKLRKDLGFLITFTWCMLNRCVEDGTAISGVVINRSLVDILSDVESHFVDLLDRCSSLLSRVSISGDEGRETLKMGKFEHMVPRVLNAYLAVLSTELLPSSTSFVHSSESMVKLLAQLLENLDHFNLEDKSIKSYVKKLEFLRNYLQLTRECCVSGQSSKEFLICVDVVAEIAACYSFLKKYGQFSSSENYLQIKNGIESETTDRLRKGYTNCIKEILMKLINEDETINLVTLQLKNQFEDLHKDVQKLVDLILNYYPKNEAEVATETATLRIYGLLQEVHVLKDHIMDSASLRTSGGIGRDSPKKGLFNFLLENLRRVNDISFDGFNAIHKDLVPLWSFIQNSKGTRAAQDSKYFINSTGHLPPSTHGLLNGCVYCINENSSELTMDDVRMPVKNLFVDLHKELELLAGQIHCHPVELEKLSDIITQYKTLVGDVVSTFLLINEEMRRNVAAQLSIFDISQDISGKAYSLKERINHICWHRTLARIAQNSCQTNQIGSLNYLIDNLRELKDLPFNLKTYETGGFQAIHEGLVLLRSFLRDTVANNSTADDDESKDLLTRIHCAASEAEYFINLYVAETIPDCCRLFWVSDFQQQVKLIRSTFSDISEKRSTNEMNDFDIIESSGEPKQLLPTSDVMVGFDNETELILERLVGDSEKLDVISIIGMAGLGKTTFARRLYEDPSIVGHFELRSWCTVSQEYHPKELLLTILGSITKLNDDAYRRSEGDLSKMLYQQLTGKRYFIVLDDIWGMGAPKYLKRFFPDNRKGSRIMLTSRSRLEDYSNPLELRLLTDEESWNLMKQKIYGENEECPHQLRQVGEKIAKKCHGLPLAIVVVAGILSKSEKKRHFWEKVAENLSLYISGDTAQAQLLTVLELSYKMLPDNLKPLFLYLGAFPEDTEIPANKLVWMWIGEGFVQTTDRLTISLEVQAELNLMDLIDRSLVMIAERRSDGRVKSCRVHDMLRDMCLVKAKEAKFMRLIRVHADSHNYATYERRLSISLTTGSYLSLRHQRTYFPTCSALFNSSIAPPLSSFLFFTMNKSVSLSVEDIIPIFADFRLLRIVHSEALTINENMYLDHIIKLVHLRYISIRVDWNSIPSSISKLWNLETLIIMGLGGQIVVPEEIWELVRLRHLHINYRANFSHALLHRRSSKLENLQTLSTPVLRCGEEKKLMPRVPNLRKFRFISAEAKNSFGEFEYQLPQLESLDQLESAKIICESRMQCISGQFGLPSSLKKLTLSKFKLQWSEISSFHRLPNLEVLKIRGGIFVDVLWDLKDVEFSKLKFLKLESLNIKQWIVSPNNFPCLTKLVLQSCKKLEEIPSSVGEFYSLEKIEVFWCSTFSANSAKQIQEDQKYLGNELLKVQIYMSS